MEGVPDQHSGLVRYRDLSVLDIISLTSGNQAQPVRGIHYFEVLLELDSRLYDLTATWIHIHCSHLALVGKTSSVGCLRSSISWVGSSNHEALFMFREVIKSCTEFPHFDYPKHRILFCMAPEPLRHR